MSEDIKTAERKLPTGVEEFNQLIKDLSEGYELPTKDEDSIKFAVATTIMHLGPQDSHKSLEFFYKTLVAGASKQVSHYVFQTIKQEQEQKRLAEQEAAKQEKADAPNEPQG